MKPGWRHHLYKTVGDGVFTPVAWDVPVTGANLTLDLSGPSSFDGSVQPEIPRLREVEYVGRGEVVEPEEVVARNQAVNPSFETAGGWFASGGTVSFTTAFMDDRMWSGASTGLRLAQATADGTTTHLTLAQEPGTWNSVVPGQCVGVAMMVAHDSGGFLGARSDVVFSGTATTYSPSGGWEPAPFYDGARIVYAAQVPATGLTAQVRVQMYSGSGVPLSAGLRLWVDDVSIAVADTEAEALAGVSEYFDGDTDGSFRWTPQGTSEKFTPAVLSEGTPVYGEPLIQNWQSVIVSERDGVIKGVSIIRDSPVDDSEMSLTGIGFAGYPTGMPFTESFKGIEVDPIDQVRRIWDHLQGKAQGDLGVVVDDTKAPNGVTIGAEEKDVSFETGDGEQVEFQSGPYVLAWHKTDDCGKGINDLAEFTPFDYRMEHKWSGESFTSFLRIGTPKIGVRRNGLRFVVGENIVDMPGMERAGDDYANEVLVLGSGEASKMRKGSAVRVSDRLRRAVVVADKSQRSNAAATKVANHELKDRLGDPDITEITVMDHPNARFNTWELGDEILVTTPAGWLKPMRLWCRVVSHKWDCEADTLTLTLQKI